MSCVCQLLNKRIYDDDDDDDDLTWKPEVQKIERRFTTRLRWLRYVGYTERLSRLGLPTLELWRLQLDLIFYYKIVFGLTSLTTSDYLIDFVSLQSLLAVSRVYNNNNIIIIINRFVWRRKVVTSEALFGSNTNTRGLAYKLYECNERSFSLTPTPHCKTNQPVHPHFKPKSGLVDSTGGYIRSDATRRRSLGAAVPSSLLSGAGHLAGEGRVHLPCILQSRVHLSSTIEERRVPPTEECLRQKSATDEKSETTRRVLRQ